jgi:hypothetical protein
MLPIGKPSRVIWVVLFILGMLIGITNQARAATTSTPAATTGHNHGRRALLLDSCVAVTGIDPEVVSRFSRFSSARISAAL